MLRSPDLLTLPAATPNVMIYKRATKRLKDAGITDISIVKCLWGPAPEHVTWERQTSRCFRTPDEAAEAVLAGYRPTRLAPPCRAEADEGPPEEEKGA